MPKAKTKFHKGCNKTATKTRQHMLIFPSGVELADEHYVFTDKCHGMAHCHACHAHIWLLIFA